MYAPITISLRGVWHPVSTYRPPGSDVVVVDQLRRVVSVDSLMDNSTPRHGPDYSHAYQISMIQIPCVVILGEGPVRWKESCSDSSGPRHPPSTEWQSNLSGHRHQPTLGRFGLMDGSRVVALDGHEAQVQQCSFCQTLGTRQDSILLPFSFWPQSPSTSSEELQAEHVRSALVAPPTPVPSSSSCFQMGRREA